MKDTVGTTNISLLRFHEIYSRVKKKKSQGNGGITFFTVNPDPASRRQRAGINNQVSYRNTLTGCPYAQELKNNCSILITDLT